MTTSTTKLLTADEFLEWGQRPENAGKRAELVRGEIVEMPLAGELHALLCGWITHLLWAYVMQRGQGGIGTNDMGLVIDEEPGTVRGPDLVLFGESLSFEQANRKHSRRIPLLVVEVLSPNDKPNQINRRISDYLRRGVPLVWIVDPDDKTVGIHRQGEFPLTVDESEHLTGNGVLADLKIAVADLFKLPGTQATT